MGEAETPMVAEAKAAQKMLNSCMMGEFLLLHKMSTFEQTNDCEDDTCVVNTARRRPTFAVAQRHGGAGRDVLSLLCCVEVSTKMVDGM